MNPLHWLRGKFGDFRLRRLGPQESVSPDAGEVRLMAQCLHRWPDGSSAWGPCTRYGGSGTWAWYATCQRCKVTVRC